MRVYEFATVALLGLAVTKAVDLVRLTTDITQGLRIALGFILGLLVAWTTDHSLFAGWGIQFRDLWMGPVATGLVIGGLAAAWHEVLDVLSSYARRSRVEAGETETRTPRAA
jgi:hypothetical protein